jgi:hypothetical protein
LATVSAKLGSVPIRLAAVGASPFEPSAALVAKSGIGRVFGLAARANHDMLRFDEHIVREVFECKAIFVGAGLRDLILAGGFAHDR